MKNRAALGMEIFLLGLLVTLSVFPRQALSQESTVLYLGNEAVLITAGDQKVLFDPFFHNDYGAYQLVPEKIQQNIFAGLPPIRQYQCDFC